ncbi:MAG: metallophosphoesterase [Acidimicrobiia bacterium]|nr:MAG: metallophosphoesterase [Acidimicrobiia bacterium]
MKLAMFADLHLDASFANLGDAGRRRRDNIRSTLTRILETAAAERVDAILCGGDLYEHERSGQDTLRFLERTFASVDVPVLVAPGNHDWFGPASLYARGEWSPNVHVFEEARLTPFELADGLTLWGAAHRAPAGTPGFLEGFSAPDSGVHIGLFHGAALGGIATEDRDHAGRPKAGHAPFRPEAVAESGLKFAFVGHYHRARDEATFLYPGNPDPLSFGERENAGLVIAEVGGDGKVAVSRISVATSRVADVELDVTGLTDATALANRGRELLASLEGSVRLTVVGEIDPALELDLTALGTLGPDLDALQVVSGALIPSYDLESLAEEQSIRGEFVRRVRNAGLDEAESREVLLVGLRALEGHPLGEP